jgi:hypothetical protein
MDRNPANRYESAIEALSFYDSEARHLVEIKKPFRKIHPSNKQSKGI